MKRSSFAPRRYLPPPPAPPRRATRTAVICPIDPNALPIAKEGRIVSEAYRSLVRQLPCARCGAPPPNQFCHADEGKGMAWKTDDRLGWPGCGPRAGYPGCHAVVGSSGMYSRTERRRLERQYSAWTRAQIQEAGQWPPGLPQLDEATYPAE